MSELNTLLLRETGIARLADGSEAVNVGPIVAALGFLTEGRGEDRGTNEHGAPLPDLLSLAFDVLQSIILGGRRADYFRQVKQDFDARSGLEGRSSLALAKQAATVRPSTPSTALERAAGELRTRLQRLDELPLGNEELAELKQALQGFRDFGADRWVAATSHLLLALKALEQSAPLPAPRRRPKTPKPAAAAKPRTSPPIKRRPAAPLKGKSRAKAKPSTTLARSKKKPSRKR